MLKISPSLRPNCAQIIKKIEKYNKVPSKKLSGNDPKESQYNLLGTIEIPKDLRQLEDLLPQAKYEYSASSKRSPKGSPNNSVIKPKSSMDSRHDSKLM